MTKTIVVLTALPVEYSAIRAYISNIREDIHSSGTRYEIGRLKSQNSNLTLAIAQISMGNSRGATEATKAIGYFKPDLLLMVGVAGGLKDDVVIGDVVIGSKVYGYEMGAAGKEFLPRPDSYPCPHDVLQQAMSIARSNDWQKRIAGEQSSNPKAIAAPIASGEKVVKDLGSEAAHILRQNFSDAVAVEMEGYGVAQAGHASNTKVAVIRGISDMIEGKNEADTGGSQERASANAAAFAFELIYQQDNHSNLSQENLLDRLWKEMAKLYPQGPLQEDIWRRSGGDVARLNLRDSGRTQWFSAIELLKNGGGGTSLKRLIATAVEDHPDNKIIKTFLE